MEQINAEVHRRIDRFHHPAVVHVPEKHPSPDFQTWFTVLPAEYIRMQSLYPWKSGAHYWRLPGLYPNMRATRPTRS